MECLKNIIGLTKKDCECFTGEITPEYKESTSGLYLDELNGGITLDAIQSVADCSEPLVDMFATARDQALLDLKADLLAQLSLTHKQQHSPYKGVVGSRNFARTKLLSSELCGIKIQPKNIVGAYITINKVFTYFDTTATGLSLSVKKTKLLADSTYITEDITVIEVSTTANQEKENALTTPLVLPLFELDGSRIEYYFLIERGSMNPKDNATRCNCGQSEMRLHQYITPVGVIGESSTDLINLSTTFEANGIILDVEAYCGSDDVICDGYHQNDGVKLATAYAIWYKAGERLIEKVLASPAINRYTMANREYLYGRKNHFKAEYFSRIQWIADQMDLSGTDCYKCEDAHGLSMGFIKL